MSEMGAVLILFSIGVVMHIVMQFVLRLPLGNDRGEAGDAVDDGSGNTGDDGSGSGDGGQVFTIPDEYRYSTDDGGQRVEKSWVSKVKSEADLYKQIDNLTSLVGKKRTAPDFEKSTPQEIEEFLALTRPQDKSAYDGLFPEGSHDALKAKIADVFHAQGIHPKIGKAIADAYIEIEQAEMQQRFSADGLKEIFKGMFGNEFEHKSGETINFTKELLSESDREYIDKKMPNETLGVFYRFANSVMDKFGVKEGTKASEGGEGGQGVTGDDLRTQADDVRKQLRELNQRQHTQAEKAELTKKLQNIYSKIAGGKK